MSTYTSGAGCGKEFQVYVARVWVYKQITVRCGNTSPDGYPWQCDECAERNSGRNWRREAEENGEAWGEEDY